MLDPARSEYNNSVALCTASPSIHNVISGVSSFISNYFISKFPPKYFKKVYIGESLNSTNFSNGKGLFTDMPKPYIGISPKFELGDTFIDILPFWSTHQYYIKNRNKHKEYKMVFEDHENDIRIFYIPNRIKLRFDIYMKLPSELSAWNNLNFLNQNFENNGVNYLNDIRIPYEIPLSFILNICNVLGLDFDNEEDKDKLREYLLSHSLNPIIEKINMSTNNPTYMCEYPANIMLRYPELANSQKIMNNLINSYSEVRYAMTAELWMPGSFILEMRNENIIKDIPEIDNSDTFKFNIITQKDLIPPTLNEKQILYFSEFIPDFNVAYDELDIKSIMSSGLIRVAKEIEKNNGNMDKCIEVKIFANNRMLTEDEYSVDFDKLIVKTKNPEENKTYAVVIYGNLKLLNTVDERIRNKETNVLGSLNLKK
ncbi:hypothetical protein FPHOBKDP_00086 [Listeria phage LPJP1]|nr:hypothetical protein FPHOBKDP_00086 [Listeria phage LPJP1]